MAVVVVLVVLVGFFVDGELLGKASDAVFLLRGGHDENGIGVGVSDWLFGLCGSDGLVYQLMLNSYD